MPRSPLTEPLLRVQGMIAYVRENLSTDEYMLFLDLLAPEPEPEPEPAKKKARKKSSKPSQSSTKSSRASGMAAQLKERRVQSGNDNWRCAYRAEGDSADCGEAQSSLVHDRAGGYAHYHPFVSTAPPAPALSPANGGAGSTTPNSEASAASAHAATRGSSE